MILKARVTLAAIFLLVNIVLISGCETTGGMVKGTTEGASKDIQGLGAAIVKLDNWIKENLW